MTFLIFSSNSPRYFVSANNKPICKLTTRLSFNRSGTLPLAIIIAKPSAMAVFPTPGSPTRHGLDLRLRTKIRITRVTSSSLPSTGSSFPAFASAVKSIEHSANVFFFVFLAFFPAPTSSRSFAPEISPRNVFTSHPNRVTNTSYAPHCASSSIASAISLLVTSPLPAFARSKHRFNSSDNGNSPSTDFVLANGFINSNSLTPARSPIALRTASSLACDFINALLVGSRNRVSAKSTCSVEHSELLNFFATSIASFTAFTLSPSNASKNPAARTHARRGRRADAACVDRQPRIAGGARHSDFIVNMIDGDVGRRTVTSSLRSTTDVSDARHRARGTRPGRHCRRHHEPPGAVERDR